MKSTEVSKIENTSDPSLVKKTLANGATMIEPKHLDLDSYTARRKAILESKEAINKTQKLETKVEKLASDISDIKSMLQQLLKKK